MDTHPNLSWKGAAPRGEPPLEQPAFRLEIGLNARASERARRERRVARNVAQHCAIAAGVALLGRVMDALRGMFEREPAA